MASTQEPVRVTLHKCAHESLDGDSSMNHSTIPSPEISTLTEKELHTGSCA